MLTGSLLGQEKRMKVLSERPLEGCCGVLMPTSPGAERALPAGLRSWILQPQCLMSASGGLVGKTAVLVFSSLTGTDCNLALGKISF